jgi:hypothetical protein
MADILKMIRSNDIVKIGLLLLAIYLLITFVNKKNEKMDNTDVYVMPEEMDNTEEEQMYMMPEGMDNIEEEKVYMMPEQLENVSDKIAQPMVGVSGSPVMVNEQQKQIDKVVAGGDKLTADELLPKYDDANAFAKENPVSKLLKEQNFLISGYHVGINTVMQSNKIPYQDIRSLPPIPKESVGPWNQSSYEQSPAQMRRFFEIGN